MLTTFAPRRDGIQEISFSQKSDTHKCNSNENNVFSLEYIKSKLSTTTASPLSSLFKSATTTSVGGTRQTRTLMDSHCTYQKTSPFQGPSNIKQMGDNDKFKFAHRQTVPMSSMPTQSMFQCINGNSKGTCTSTTLFENGNKL